MSVKVSSKYQVVIPGDVRERLNLRPGAEVDVIAKGGIAYIVPVRSIKDLQGELEGQLTEADIRGARDKKDRKL